MRVVWGEWCDRPCTVQCRVQAAARRTPPQHAAAPPVCAPCSAVYQRRVKVGQSDRFSSPFFVLERRTPRPRTDFAYFLLRPLRILWPDGFSLSLFGLVVFTTLQFRDEDVPPCESGLRGPPWCISSLHSGLVSVFRPRAEVRSSFFVLRSEEIYLR